MLTDILIAPQSIVCAGNPIVLQLRANDVNIARYSFFLIHYITPTTAVNIASWTQDPDHGTSNIFTFQFESIIQDNLGIDLRTEATAGYFACQNSIFTGYVIAVGVSDSGSAVSNSVVTTDIFNAINGGLAIDSSTYFYRYFIESYTHRFLTASPNQKWISLSDSEYLGVVSDYKGPLVFNVKIARYNVDGSTNILQINLSDLHTDVKGDVSVGPANLNDVYANFISSNTKHYDILVPTPTGTNYFTDGDNGSFTSSIAGITAGSSIVASMVRESLYGYTAAGVLHLVTNTNAPAGGELWHNNTLMTLLPNTTYSVYSRVKFFADDPQTVDPFNLTLEAIGFTGATITQANTEFKKEAHGTYKLVMGQLTTGTDTTGYLQMNIDTGKAGYHFFVDDVRVKVLEDTPVKRYKLDHACHTNPTRVHFLNRLGAMDSYTFTGTEVRSLKTSATEYTQRIGHTYNAGSRGRQVIHKQTTESLICSTGPITANEMLWLEELLSSPEVYIQENGYYKPVVLKDGSFTTVDAQQNIHKLKVELERANAAPVQRT